MIKFLPTHVFINLEIKCDLYPWTGGIGSGGGCSNLTSSKGWFCKNVTKMFERRLKIAENGRKRPKSTFIGPKWPKMTCFDQKKTKKHVFWLENGPNWPFFTPKYDISGKPPCKSRSSTSTSFVSLLIISGRVCMCLCGPETISGYVRFSYTRCDMPWVDLTSICSDIKLVTWWNLLQKVSKRLQYKYKQRVQVACSWTHTCT